MALISDFTASNIPYVVTYLTEIALDHSEQRCVPRIFFHKHIILILVMILIMKRTQSLKTVVFGF